MENNDKNLVRRCCICKTIILDGKLTPKESYNMDELMKTSDFTDTYLSYDCFARQYGKEWADRLEQTKPFENKRCL